MPEYRVGYLLTYRVAATGDGDATRKVMDRLTAAFPQVEFVTISSEKSSSQAVAGSTTFDVQLLGIGVVTATDIADSLTKVTPPAQGLVASLAAGSVDLRALGHF